MQIKIQTDNHIEGGEGLVQWATGAMREALHRYSGQISRLEVHFSDQNGGKNTSPENKNCMIEVRLEGHQPLAVKHGAASLNQALAGAADKMLHLIENTLGRSART